MGALERRLFAPGPKRVLSLDGGGVRGIVTLGFLERAERLLCEASGDPDFRLCDHYDLVGGTSTGAVIAAGIALGYSVADLTSLYLDLSHRAFKGWRWHGGILAPKFQAGNLYQVIRDRIGDTPLGSEALRSGLAIVAKRIDTGSPWVFHNNPRSRYFDPPADDPTALANRDLSIARILRASTAAPTYFEPEEIAVAEGLDGLFVDGGVSPYNNPSLLLLMMVTSRGYGYGWPTGPDRLSVTAVGTGLYTPQFPAAEFLRMPSSLQAVHSLEAIITDTMWQAQAVLQWLGTSTSPWPIDSEAGDLAADMPAGAAVCRYERFDVLMDREWLARRLNVQVSADELTMLRQLDRPEMAERLLDIARAAAAQQVSLAALTGAGCPDSM